MRTRQEKEYPSIFGRIDTASTLNLRKSGGDNAHPLCQWPECNFEGVVSIARGAMKKVDLCRVHRKEFSKHPLPEKIDFQPPRKNKRK
jgi:hypothetical protein